MKNKKLQILIPQYKETEEVISPLLTSIALQKGINFDDIGVIIVNDGSECILSDEFLKGFPYDIEYHKKPHTGISATRNEAFYYSTAEYVMWCDADDMFYCPTALFIIFRSIERDHFDVFACGFVEETKDPNGNGKTFIQHRQDATFIHGKVYNRQFLKENNLLFNPSINCHEDVAFNAVTMRVAKNARYSEEMLYLWAWNDNSICRHDPFYMQHTYDSLIDAYEDIVKTFLDRGYKEEALWFACKFVFLTYYELNMTNWVKAENQPYRDGVEKKFAEWYRKYGDLYENAPEKQKMETAIMVRQQMLTNGLLFENVVFEDWINKIKGMIS